MLGRHPPILAVAQPWDLGSTDVNPLQSAIFVGMINTGAVIAGKLHGMCRTGALFS